MIYILAWRNIWRNKKRTFLLILSIVLGLGALLIAISFLNGLNSSFIDNALNTEISHIQIHHPDYGQDYNPRYCVKNKDSLIRFLENNKKLKSFTLRTKVEGLASSSKSSRGITMIGIDPEMEAKVTGIDKLIYEGDYFKGVTRHPALIGKKLANKLSLKLNSKLLITFINSNNEISGESFRVSGILESNSPRLNEMYVYIKKEDFYTAFLKDTIIHEIAVKLNTINEAKIVKNEIARFSPMNHIETWNEIAPELEASISQTKTDKTIVMIVIILAFTFGLINTLQMQINERTREIGMLIANGMKRYKVFLMIIIESVFSVTLASILGMLIGFLIITYFNHFGMDFTSLAEGFSSLGWSKIIYPDLYAKDYLQILACCLFSGLIGAAFPAFKALRLNVITAMRKV